MDTNVRHTPGPWANNGGRIEACEPYTSQSINVAVVGEANHQTPTDTANARLIAAAPELLEALESLVATIAAHDIESLSCDRDGEKYCDCLRGAANNARAAIAKATEQIPCSK